MNDFPRKLLTVRDVDLIALLFVNCKQLGLYVNEINFSKSYLFQSNTNEATLWACH